VDSGKVTAPFEPQDGLEFTAGRPGRIASPGEQWVARAGLVGVEASGIFKARLRIDDVGSREAADEDP
jgi:hypothetical protein